MTTDESPDGRALVPFSHLKHREVVDEHGRRVSLLDLAVDVRDGEYPKISRVLVGRGNAARELPASDLRLSESGRDLRIDDLAPAAPSSAKGGVHEILLLHDLVDALIIDLERRGPARVNDILLEQHDEGLRLKAIDTSAPGIARRLTRGRWPAPSEADLTDWRYVAFLRGDPDRRADDVTCGRIARLPPGEIARLSTALPYLHAAELIGLLPDHAAAEVFADLAPERQIQVFEELGVEQASNLLALLAPDAATDLLSRLEPDLARRHLDRLPRRVAGS